MPIYEVEAPDGRILEIEGNQPPSEKELDVIFATVGNKQQPSQPEYNPKMNVFNKEWWQATPEQRTENIKARGRQELQQRQEWEQNHPVVSEIQKAFQPGYRADLVRMQTLAEYGDKVPFVEGVKSQVKQVGQDLVPAVNIATAIGTGGLGTAKGLLPAVGKAVLQGGIQGGVEGLTGGLADEGLSVNALNRGLQGLKTGATVGGSIPVIGTVAKKPFEIGSKVVGRIGKGLGTGLLENVGVSKNAFNRMKTSPRGTALSENHEVLGSNEFITDVAEKFKNGVEQLRNQEITNFAKARDNLIAQNKDVTVDLTPYTQKAIDSLKSMGLINENGITRAGQRATGLTEFLEDLQAYSNGKFDINELQSLKSNILDDIINYKAPQGQYLGKSTSSLQKIAKEMRKDVNNVLNEKLGAEYGAINKRLSEVLDILDNNPELKDLTKAQSIDTLTNKIKRAGTVRTQTGKELQKLEKIMNENGIKISDYSLLDDILDYTTAKEINTKVGTGLAGGFANTVRRAAAQPIIEGLINSQSRINPIINTLQGVGRKVRPVGKVLQSPALYSGLAVPTLQGGIVYNEDRY